MIVLVDYASPSVLQSTRTESQLDLSANARRPVSFHGKVVKHGFLLRIALRALGEAIWSDDSWLSQSEILDPVITVHPDRIFFEAFSQDQSTYASLILDRNLFHCVKVPTTGTTNVDFSAWLWGALGEMRSSRDTTFRIGAEGFEVATLGSGGRFEKKVDLPESWVRGFLQVQAAMGMVGTRLSVKPIDLLSAIRFLRYTKAKVSPRGLRYEFNPGQDAQLVLEPWEKVIPLEGAEHNYSAPKTTRVWGRRRLKLIEGLLPFADSVEIYLKGRALPSFYAVNLPGMTFLLGLTGWSGNSFTSSGGFDLLAEAASADDTLLAPAIELLSRRYRLSADDLARELSVDLVTASRVLVRLCRQGRCMFDVQRREYRHRELFEQAIEEATYFPPDLRQERATRWIQDNCVEIQFCVNEETSKAVRLKSPEGKSIREVIHRDWRVIGRVDNGVEKTGPIEVVVNDSGQIIFGRCVCSFFQENLLNLGPCEHILALYRASDTLRIDQTSSKLADAAAQTVTQPSKWEVEPRTSSEEDEIEEDE